jgi:hypothetical protein
MLCDLCHRNEARRHIYLFEHGRGRKTFHLCDPCADAKGPEDSRSDSNLDLLREVQERRHSRLAARVNRAVFSAPVFDIHTHLYDPAFGELLLWGIDDLLTYHYLVAEVFRYVDMSYEKFWQLTKAQQADLIWKKLFVEHSPVSEACRGVVTTLQSLGCDPKQKNLAAIRKSLSNWKLKNFISHCLSEAGVAKICMTNSPFDDLERPVWLRGFKRDARFVAALRIDPLLLAWNDTAPRLREWGYEVGSDLSPKTIREIQRFLRDWTRRIQAKYLMVSLTPQFAFPDAGACAQLIEKAVLPHCREFGLPFALMIGVRRAQNPGLQMAGDGMGRCDLSALANLCAQYPDNKFLVTVLARENQHELCVLARKFRNLHIFGCWWFTNVPYVVEEMTRMRIELLGLSVTPQHSDARILDQLIYKWQHSRRIIAEVLVEKYAALAESGWEATPAEIERDARELLGGGFERFCAQ